MLSILITVSYISSLSSTSQQSDSEIITAIKPRISLTSPLVLSYLIPLSLAKSATHPNTFDSGSGVGRSDLFASTTLFYSPMLI